jgi:cytochrome c oxidase subunit 2
VNRLRITPERPGIYRGQCAEYCGGSHALMALVAVVHEPQLYNAWESAQSLAAREPLTDEEQRGKSLFAENGCGACHMIRGTEASGAVGPDLTHVGSRLTLAAASFPNNLGTLAGWISSAQHLKPGNRMPSFNRLTGVELRALASYLKSLE